MPGLVDEVGVAGDGVDLTADGLEVGVFIGQVLQFRGADEGEVGGIEEEHGPLAQHICLADGLEGALVIGLDGELADLFVDHRHGEKPPCSLVAVWSLLGENIRELQISFC